MTVRISGPPRRRAAPALDRRALRSRAHRMLEELGLAHQEVSISLVDDARIAELNRDFRGRSGPTDVLSFSLVEGDFSEFRGPLLGEVVIGVETAARQAQREGHPLDEEVTRLLIHGLLHLLGHDHEQPAEARVMRREERRLWSVLHG